MDLSSMTSRSTTSTSARARTSTRPSTKISNKTPVSSRFPLNQNNLVMLKETRVSVRQSVASAVRWYAMDPARPMKELEKYPEIYNAWMSEEFEESSSVSSPVSSPEASLFSNQSPSPLEDDMEGIDKEGSYKTPLESKTTQSMDKESTESNRTLESDTKLDQGEPGTKPNQGDPVKCGVLKSINQTKQAEYNDTRLRLNQLIAEVLNLQTVEEDVANYTINGIMCHNDFINLRLKPSRPIRKDVRTALARLIQLFYTDCYLTKHRERFLDEVTHGLSTREPIKELEIKQPNKSEPNKREAKGEQWAELSNPKWFDLFLKIWKFDPESYEIYDESFFVDYMESVYREPEDVVANYRNTLINTGFFMNLAKFRHYYGQMNILNYGSYGYGIDEEEESLEEINRRYVSEYEDGGERLEVKIKFDEDVGVRVFDGREPVSVAN